MLRVFSTLAALAGVLGLTLAAEAQLIRRGYHVPTPVIVIVNPPISWESRAAFGVQELPAASSSFRVNFDWYDRAPVSYPAFSAPYAGGCVGGFGGGFSSPPPFSSYGRSPWLDARGSVQLGGR